MTRIKRELGIGLLASFVAVVFLLTSAISVFAQEPRTTKGYTYNLKQLIEQAEKNIKRVEEELKEKEIEKENQQRELEAREHFEKGNALYKEGKLKEAKQAWQKALEITKKPEMKGYIKESKKRARAEELARKKEEREQQKRLAAEQKQKEKAERQRQRQLKAEEREKARLEKERLRKEELARKKKELEERKEQKKLEAEKRKKRKR